MKTHQSHNDKKNPCFIRLSCIFFYFLQKEDPFCHRKYFILKGISLRYSQKQLKYIKYNENSNILDIYMIFVIHEWLNGHKKQQ